MTDTLFQIGAPGVDVTKVMQEVRQAVHEKREKGVYTDPRVARAERTNLARLKDDDDFLEFYLECLRDAAFVDIDDFDIVERRSRFNRLLVAFKKAIWKLLKFYTYRLWSQQNQVNGLLLSAIESIESAHKDKIAALESRIAELEKCRKPEA